MDVPDQKDVKGVVVLLNTSIILIVRHIQRFSRSYLACAIDLTCIDEDELDRVSLCPHFA